MIGECLPNPYICNLHIPMLVAHISRLVTCTGQVFRTVIRSYWKPVGSGKGRLCRMDHSYLYQCTDESCGQMGTLDCRSVEIPGISEPTWVPCPNCGGPMEPLRQADDHEVQNLPMLTRYCRLGPIFSIRTDGPAYEGASFGSAESGVSNATAPEAPVQQENPDSDVIFTPEAACILKATESRTAYLARTGVIPAFKVGKKEWRYSRKALEEWVQKQANGSFGVSVPIPVPSIPKPSVKSKATKKRKNLPTDLSPEALKKAIQRIRHAGE
jgi:hypothetical protein